MNVNDVSERDVTLEGDMLKAIFEKQGKLMEKYHHIEEKLRLTTDCPVNLHDAKGQLLLKDFAWRTTEELAEAFDELMKIPEDGPGANESEEAEAQMVHVREEVADALHFLTEMGILSGITAENIVEEKYDGCTTVPVEDYLDSLFNKADTRRNRSVNHLVAWSEFQVKLGMVCHTLKNKPWKQSQMMTDIDEYTTRYIGAFHQFIALCINLGFNSEQLYSLYFRKNKVNEFRQRSNY